jgi:exosome complex RNA-binding protein Rrp42 (RNase PH superfamily)
MQESGDFRLLRNAEIKKSILKLDRRHKDIATLQTNYLQAIDDGYIPLMMNRFDIATMSITDPALLEDQLFRNFFAYAMQDTDSMVAMYKLARAQSEELVAMIEEELSN